MNVSSIIEGALYLSIKDRYFNALPQDAAAKKKVLEIFLADLNTILVGIGKKNPAFSHLTVPSAEVKDDKDIKMSYIDLQKKFLTLFRVEFITSGGSLSITLQRLGINDFFSSSDMRTMSSFPAFYNYNTFSNRLYIYPKPNASGVFNIFGKERIGPFSSVDEEFSPDVSETFLLYLQYYFAKFLCSQYNAPWQAQKEELLRSYKRLVDSENNISYQETSINSGCDLLPLRNIRIGL